MILRLYGYQMQQGYTVTDKSQDFIGYGVRVARSAERADSACNIECNICILE